MKKYRLVESERESEQQGVYQIQALRDFTTDEDREVKAGELGGFVSGEHNLSHEGNCWVASPAEVWGNACVSGNAFVGGFSYLYDNVQVLGNARVTRGRFYENARIYDNAVVAVKGWLAGNVEVFGSACVVGKDTTLSGNVKIFEQAQVGGGHLGTVNISGNVQVSGNASIQANCELSGDIHIGGDAVIQGSTMATFKSLTACKNQADSPYDDEQLVALFVQELKRNPEVSIAYLQRCFSLGFVRASKNLEKAKHLFMYRKEQQ